MKNKLSISKGKLSVLLFTLLFITTILMFQNCSKQNFTAEQSSLDTKIDYYTNQKNVPIKVELDPKFVDRYDKMRVYLNSETNVDSIPWQPLSDSIILDLGDEFNENGSKDGEKLVAIEVKESAGEERVTKVIRKIFLDTQEPKLVRLGLLDQGIQGRKIEKDEPVEINWTMNDPKALSGAASGLDEEAGFRWGYAPNEDCTAGSNTSEWMSIRESLTVPWPEGDPLKAFYFCLYGRDMAKNVAVIFSQPMTSLWYVFAGDNYQGNGSSVTSNQVRFKTPHFLYLDPDKNIHVSDDHFRNWRRINNANIDPSRTIESSPLKHIPTTPVVYDSAGNAYYPVHDSIFKLSKGSTDAVKIIDGMGTSYLAIRNYKNVERLLIYHYLNTPTTYVGDDPIAKSFLFEIPLSALGSSLLNYSNLISTYKIAGNGTMASTSFVIPDEVILSKNDPVDKLHSLSVPRAVATSPSGEIFISTITDGANRGFGHQTVRRLTPQADGTFKQKLLAAPTWIGQLAYHKQGTKEILVGGGSYQPFVADLTTGVVTKPFAEFPYLGGGGAVVVPHDNNLDYDYYFTVGSSSQIYHYASNFRLIEVFGRPVYDDIQDPLAAIIGNPDGLAQDPNGDLYFVDSQNALIRKVSRDGVLSRVTGQVQTYIPTHTYVNESFDSYILDSRYFLVGSHKTQLVGDFNSTLGRKMLYVTTVTGQIDAIDVVNGRVNSLIPSTTESTDAKYFWTNSSMALVSEPNDQNTLLVSKRYIGGSPPAWHDDFVGFVASIKVQGNQFISKSSFLGDITNNDYASNPTNTLIPNSLVAVDEANQSIKVDSQKIVYISGPQFKITKLGMATPKTQILNITMDSFVVIEKDINTRLIIYITQSGGTLNAVELDVRKFLTTESPILVNSKKLCLPGTSLGWAYDLIVDTEGNLVISDTKKGRILKYNIRSDDGSLKLSYCP